MNNPSLIYTFDESVLQSKTVLTFYNKSIELANKLGYITELYTNSDKISTEVTFLHRFNDKYVLSDYTKHIPLERNDNPQPLFYQVFD